MLLTLLYTGNKVDVANYFKVSNSMQNMLVSARVRTSTPNETVLWTAPTDYLGRIVFV